MSSEASLEVGDAEAPRVRPFVLTFTAPAAMPWDQWRLVKLEAGHAAPLPEDQVHLSLRRLAPWRPGREGRFAAAYFRRAEVVGDVHHTEMVDGEPIEFLIQDHRSAQRALWQSRLPIAGVAAAVAISTAATLVALGDRERTDMALNEQYQSAVRSRVLGEKTQRRIEEQRALARAGAEGTMLADALLDIGWLSRARDPNAALTKIEWRPDGLVIEAVGTERPFAAEDREIAMVSTSGGKTRWQASTAKATTARASAP